LTEKCSKFVDTTIIHFDKTLGSYLKRYLTSGKSKNSKGGEIFSAPAPKPITPSEINNLLDCDPKEIARQLTLMDYNLAKVVQPKECLGMAWTKKDKEQRSPNLLKMIERFNKVSKWSTYTIVKETSKSKRARLVTHFIDILKNLRDLNNFHAIFAITGGLGNSAVFRLNKTWATISGGSTKILEEMRLLTKPEKSWSQYRNTIHAANPPCVPFFGVYQTDLTFIEDGNKTTLENGFVNFKKCRLVSHVIEEVQQYQQSPYNLTLVPNMFNWLQTSQLEAGAIEEKQFYDLSLQDEPRE